MLFPFSYCATIVLLLYYCCRLFCGQRKNRHHLFVNELLISRCPRVVCCVCLYVQLSSQTSDLQSQLHEAQELLRLKGEDLRRTGRSHEESLGENRLIQQQMDSEKRHNELLHQELVELRYIYYFSWE